MRSTLSRKSSRSERIRLSQTFVCEGICDDQYRPYIRVKRWNGEEENRAGPISVIPFADCEFPQRFHAYLHANGVIIPSAESRRNLMREASRVLDFERSIVEPYPGFNDGSFAFANGDVLLGPIEVDQIVDGDAVNTIRPIIGYNPEAKRNRRDGELKQYRERMSALLEGQDLLIFALCVSLAAPLIRFSDTGESFGFQICGSTCSNKTLMTAVAASVWGFPSVGGEIWDVRDLEYLHWDQKLDTCADQPLLLDGLDRWFALGNCKQKLEYVKRIDAVFHHSLSRLAGSVTTPARIVFWSTSQEPIEALCGDDEKAAARLQGRLLTIPVPEDRPGKVVAPVPSGGSLDRMIGQLRETIEANHGHAARRMIRRILEQVSGGEGELRLEIRSLVHDFVSKSCVDSTDGAALRAAQRFGLVYAAGTFARKFGAIAKSLDVEAAVLACYSMYRNGAGSVSFEDRLRARMAGNDVVDLGSGKLPAVDNERRAASKLYVRRKSGIAWICIRRKHIHDVFPDWPALSSSEQVGRLLCTEIEDRAGNKHRHRLVKRKLGADKKPERVYCFELKDREA